MTWYSWIQLIDDLRSDDENLIFNASETISKVADKSHIADLYYLLQDASFIVREAVAIPLARLEGVNALPALFQALTRGFQEGYDNDGLSATIADLLEDHQAAAAPVLLSMLSSADNNVRDHAAWGLGFVASEVTADPLLLLLSDASVSVRSSAVGSLTSFENDPRVLDVLLGALQDSSEQVRISAASSLGYLGDQRAVEPMKTMLKRASRKYRPIVKDALERLGSS